ncbi:tetratricopeptide repeat protein [Microbispora sp. ATCC PTA-5024]|uniref:tetratricopeptide repeat protein n=1 Tax=Microbispora sp. ATCC PTA-5024 TaxID=316330 RepID=UPI0004220EDD|nr:tetratricopeptide repeat protein [Microbispora sp. ATCC PTA-5024]
MSPVRRRMSLAAPAVAGMAAAVASALGTSLDIWTLPLTARIVVTVAAAALVGTLTWATATPHASGEGTRGPEGAPPPAELPPVIAHFTGRREILDELRHRFAERDADAPLVVSLYGRGGVGKSALAARFAHEVIAGFPDGQLYFDLRGADGEARPEEVLAGFLRALGVRLTTDPGGLTELQKLWWTWTKDRRILILLDNAQNADQVTVLVPPEPRCAVIVTSRQPLFLRNRYDRQLGAFTEAQGVELLARLAGDDRIAADLDAALEIVRLCDRLPLAISICGGRLATRENWSLAELAGRLGDERRRLDQLQVGREIDKSVRASLQLSYDDCTDIQRRLLRLLGLLTAPDVQAWVAGDLLDASELDGADQLEALVDAQLAECSGTDATGHMRYRLHELVRLFAYELAVREEQEPRRLAAIERVLYGYRRRAEAAATDRWPQDWRRRGRRPGPSDGGAAAERQISSAGWFTAERLALLASVHQARAAGLWDLAWATGRAFCSLCHSLRAYWSDWRAVADIACEAAERTGDTRALGIALLERAAVAGGIGRYAEARADADRARELFDGLGETWWAARAMRTVGMTLFSEGNLDRAQGLLLAAVDAFKAEDDRWWQARTQRNLAELRLAQRRYAEARELLEDSLTAFQSGGNRYSEAQTQRVLGEVLAAEARRLLAAGDAMDAERRFVLAGNALRFAIRAFHDRNEEWEEARCLRAAGEIGDPQNGLQEYASVREAKETLAKLGDSWGVARTEMSEAGALARLGRQDEAVEGLRGAARHFAELGDRWWQARGLRTLSEVLLEAGRRAEAREPAAEALAIYRSLGNEAGMSRAQDVLERASRG